MRLRDLAAQLGCRLHGDGEVEVEGVRPLAGAGPRDLAFVADPSQLSRLAESAAGAVLVREGSDLLDRPALLAANLHLAFARALGLLHPPPPPPSGIHPTAVLAPDVELGPEVWVGPLSVVEAGARIGTGSRLEAQVYVGAGVEIGAGCRLYPQVVLRDGVRLGARVTVHSGAVIGADGFGYARDGARYVKIPQLGGVVLEDDVEIGANTTIDRATLEETRIGRGTKIDNLVQIGHNVQVGSDTVIVAQVGVSGSSRIGSRVTLAGQVGIVDHVTIGDGAVVGGQAGVSKDIPPNAVVLGAPAIPHGEYKRQLAAMARLPLLRKTLQALEARVQALETRRND